MHTYEQRFACALVFQLQKLHILNMYKMIIDAYLIMTSMISIANLRRQAPLQFDSHRQQAHTVCNNYILQQDPKIQYNDYYVGVFHRSA